MDVIVAASACAIVLLTGRNDGSPLASIAQSTSRGTGRWAPLVIVGALPIAPLLGVHHVADSLDALAAGPAASDAALSAFLIAIIATISLSVALSAPNSITLAIVGALAGTSLATGADVDVRRIVTVLVIATTAPIAAALLAWWLTRLPLHLGGLRADAVLAGARKAAFGALALAYSANDGQKVLFLVAVASGSSIDASARGPIHVATGMALFGAGTLIGLRRSGRALRHGASSPSPVQSLWSQTSAAIVVSVGAAVGTPMSMTQAMVGGVVGAGLTRGWRALRWMPVVRITLSWLWSLPASAAIAYLLTQLLTHLFSPLPLV
ncbi:inorganic phosphate transporter [Plantibacter sp. Mn2098]|uniref:inorganic phosphate transporter n=1 Tax=Plantibacter sp. Mn2098 TaxID=3395266 RepID=UPI003BDDF562